MKKALFCPGERRNVKNVTNCKRLHCKHVPSSVCKQKQWDEENLSTGNVHVDRATSSNWVTLCLLKLCESGESAPGLLPCSIRTKRFYGKARKVRTNRRETPQTNISAYTHQCPERASAKQWRLLLQITSLNDRLTAIVTRITLCACKYALLSDQW